MEKIDFKIKIIDNFLNDNDFNELQKFNLDKEFKEDFKVYHNKINDDGIIESTIDQNLLKRIHKNNFLKTINILKEINPEKFELYEYSDFSVIITKKNSKFPIHDDTPNKLLSGVIYLSPEKNLGTIFYSDKKGSNKTSVEWKQNRAVFFSRSERKTWHSYEGDGLNNRMTLVYNLMTSKIKEVYKIENNNFFLGNFRYKINPYVFRFFKKII